MQTCKYFEKYAKKEEFIGSLGVNYPIICTVEKCPYKLKDSRTKICKSQGLIKKLEEKQ